jgi:hypothetical protein
VEAKAGNDVTIWCGQPGEYNSSRHSEITTRETAGGASHFLYGQDPGFRDLYVGANFGSHQQGVRLVPQQHAAQAHLDLAKSQLHDHLLSNPPFKCILHTARGLVPRRGSMGDSQSDRYCQKLWLATGEKPPCSIRDEVHPNLDERTSSVRDVGKQTGETLQRMRTFAALKGLGVGVGPAGEPK